MGVPIDPRTQMPVPNKVVTTEVVVWIDFRFQEIDESVLPFVELSIHKIDTLLRALEPHI